MSDQHFAGWVVATIGLLIITGSLIAEYETLSWLFAAPLVVGVYVFSRGITRVLRTR